MPEPRSASADELLRHLVLTDEGRQDPAPGYLRLLTETPRWTTDFDSVVTTRYRDVLEVLRNPRLGRFEADMPPRRGLAGPPPRGGDNPGGATAMLLLNPPDHTRLRALVSREFTPRRIEAMRPRLEALVAELLDEVESAADADGVVDIVAALAVPYPVAVISELLGVDREDSRAFVPLAQRSTALIEAAADDATRADGLAAVMELATYVLELLERRRDEPDDGLFSALIRTEAEGDRLTVPELIANTVLLYAAGFETTSNLIGNGLKLLLDHPGELERLRAEPELTGPAVWEMLRRDSPVQLNGRAVLEPVELFGEQYERGAGFITLQGAANLDPDVYPDPLRFDVGRFTSADVPPPMSFGWGVHHCLGAHLARAEGEILFRALLDRFPRIEPAWSDDRPLHFRGSFTLRGLDALPVRLGG